MDRTQQRCLLGSTAAHVGLLIAVLVASGLAARRALQPDVPFLEMIPTDLALTMGNQIGGGNPNATPPAPKPPAPQPAKATEPEPAPPPVQQKTIEKTEPPVVPKAVEKVVEKTAPPEPVKTPEAKVEPSKTVKPLAKAQDVDATKKPEKATVVPPTKIQVSSLTRTRTDVDRQAEREAREAREAKAAAKAAAEEAAQAEARRVATAQKLASRLAGAATGVSENVGSSTKIDMPGPGGVAYAPYLSWLERYLYERWKRPNSSSQQQLKVEMEVVIARDGTVLSAKITQPSGVRSMDVSAEEVFRQNRKLRPLPDDYKEPRLVVPVKFVLEAPGSQ